MSEAALREQILATLRRHIGAHADIVTNDLMHDVETAIAAAETELAALADEWAQVGETRQKWAAVHRDHAARLRAALAGTRCGDDRD